MSTYEIRLNVNVLNSAADRAFKETAFILGREFTRVITEPRTWAGFDGARDIVDNGILRSSQQLQFTQPFEAVYSWPVAYAAPVHEGYTLRNGKQVEGRPWTQVALQEFNVEAEFARLYEKYLNS